MINDALFILWDCTGVTSNISTNVTTLYDGDKEVYTRICDVAKSHCKIQNFVESFCFRARKAQPVPIYQHAYGLYTQALSEGLDEILEKYRSSLVELESQILGNPSLNLVFIYSAIEKYHGLFNTLNRIIWTIKEKKLRGCQILSVVYQHILSGNEDTRKSVLQLFSIVNIVFYNQLCSWLLYGELKDPYQEFIIHKLSKDQTILHDTALLSPSTYDRTLSSLNDSSLECGYGINEKLLPYYLPLSMIQEILFIGRTVVIFGLDPRKIAKAPTSSTRNMLTLQQSNSSNSKRFTIWDENEAEFHDKLQDLKNAEVFDVNQFGSLLCQIKSCVTKHLWLVTVQEAHMIEELQLMKDFFLLGRGELFLELIRLTEHILNEPPTPVSTGDMNQAFRLAARAVFLANSEDVEKFSFELPYDKSASSSFDTNIKDDGWSTIVLKYKFKWPLHLLLTPEVLSRYNDMFRLLLRLKRTQHNLHLLWKTRKHSPSSSLWQLHNKLIFMMDNLQRYLQADVLDTNYSRLMLRATKLADFEELKKAHATFLADILSQSFLFVVPILDESRSSDCTDNINNPVFCNIMELVRLCDAFCNMAASACHDREREFHLQQYTLSFETTVAKLLALLAALRSQPCGAYLARLLMRLDYNRWFSSEAHLTQSITSMLY